MLFPRASFVCLFLLSFFNIHLFKGRVTEREKKERKEEKMEERKGEKKGRKEEKREVNFLPTGSLLK